MAVKSFNLAWISVKDFKKSIAFYRDVLGLKIHQLHEEFGWVEFQGSDGGALLGIGKEDIKESIRAGQNAVVTFVVDDILKSKAELIQKGVKMVGDIMEVPNTVKLQSFLDPDGNHAQLVEVLHKKGVKN